MKKFAYVQIEKLAEEVRGMDLKNDFQAIEQLIENTILTWPRSLQCRLAGAMCEYTMTDDFEWLDGSKATGEEKFSPTYAAQAVLVVMNGFDGINFDINLAFYHDFEDISIGAFRNAIIDAFSAFDENRFYLLRIEHSGDINSEVIALVCSTDIKEDMTNAHIKFAQHHQGGEFNASEGKFEINGTFQAPIEMKEILNDEFNTIKHLLKPKVFMGINKLGFDELEVEDYLKSMNVTDAELPQ